MGFFSIEGELTMKVLLINGSPHAHGNTATALNEMVKIFDAEGVESKIVQVGKPAGNALNLANAFSTTL